jgi:hypothetical protein
MREEARLRLDSIPKILLTEVLVCGVLIVVVIRDWQTITGVLFGCWNKYIGILPPNVGRRIESWPDVVMIAVTSIEKGRSGAARDSSKPKACDRKSGTGSLRLHVRW